MRCRDSVAWLTVARTPGIARRFMPSDHQRTHGEAEQIHRTSGTVRAYTRPRAGNGRSTTAPDIWRSHYDTGRSHWRSKVSGRLSDWPRERPASGRDG